MSAKFKDILQVIVVIAALLLFLGIFAAVVYEHFGKNAHEFGPNFAAFANTMNGLVGGIVAAAFGISVGSLRNAPATGFRSRRHKVGQVVAGDIIASESAKEWLAAIYAGAYMLVGFVAIGIWLSLPAGTLSEADVIIKSIATVFVGMLIPIVKAFFTKA